MQNLIQGTFHFHSTYSHDGRNTLREIASSLREKGFSFCLMTEHFEDFDALKFNRYVGEANEVTKSTGFIFIPGVEVDIAGLHTIVFPVHDYDEISKMEWAGGGTNRRVCKVLAHPSKYPFELVQAHMEKYKIDGLELWNQQADSGYIPPLKFLDMLKNRLQRSNTLVFFGCDLHSVDLSVANVISLSVRNPLTAEAILTTLMDGDFVSRNLTTGIEYHNGSMGTDLNTWIQSVMTRPYHRAKLRMRARRCLRWLYKLLPRNTQHSLNDIKNYLRNEL